MYLFMSGIKRENNDFFGDADILFLVSHCSNDVMKCCIFDAATVMLRGCDETASLSAYEKNFMLRFACSDGKSCRQRMM